MNSPTAPSFASLSQAQRFVATGLPWVLLFSLLSPSAFARSIDFVRDVRPIFVKYCYECHGEQKQKSGLRLDVKEAAFKGGDNYAPNITPGDVAASSLIDFVTSTSEHEVMPPEGPRLSQAEIDVLTAWISQGAVWPDGVDTVKLKDKRDHWSFKPLATARPQAFIDSFVLAKLTEQGLTFSPETDRVSWLRRVSIDLIGLPPTPEQVEEFVADEEASAYARVVDSLLNSPRYGERWAQHWLDVVRFADTHGFEVNTERPNAWPYRDYVIDALNADTPYDQFIREQIVGDALGKDAATGFLITASVLLPGQIGKDAASMRLARQDAIDEIVNNVSLTFLGLSVGCARCHDHKFDPVSAADYYAMQAFVAGVEYQDRELRTPEAEAARQESEALEKQIAEIDTQLASIVPLAKSGATRPMINARLNTDRFAAVKAKRVRLTIHATNNLEPCLDEVEIFRAGSENSASSENIALAIHGAAVTSSGDKVSTDRHELKFLNDGKYGNSRSWMSSEVGKGWVEIEFPQEQTLDRVVWGRDREGKFADRLAIDYKIEVADAAGAWKTVADANDRDEYNARESKVRPFSTQGLSDQETEIATQLTKQRQTLAAKVAAASQIQKAFAGVFRQPDKIHLLNRGDPEQPKQEIAPAVLSSLGDVKLAPETSEQQRRMALADWIASPQNPLTARVMVNRIWQGHFGSGIVQTPSDFGNNGALPTHPELLDWLAQQFIASGWSIKQMHRQIVLSRTYRQSSMNHPQGLEKDADVRLLWRYPSPRLTAEVLRDSILAVSGSLNLKMHGRGYDLFEQRGGLSGFKPIESFTGEGLRRMIYAHKVRREPEAVFGAFDCPDAGQSTATRRESTTPIQALNLFNSQFTFDQANAFAARVHREVGDELPRQITRAFQLALSREPTADERADIQPLVERHGLATLCRVLFNCNEFMFLP